MNYGKQFIVAVVAMCSFQLATAQSNYINYTIKTGETLSVIAKKYNTTVGDIMRMNGMHADSKINAGSNIKIPSKTTATVAKKEVVTPAVIETPATKQTGYIHTVGKGETLFSIGKKFGVTVAELKQWNHLTSDHAQAGATLIVGQKAAAIADAATTKTAVVETPAVKAPVVQAPVVQTPPEQKQRVETVAPKPDNNTSTDKNESASDQNTAVQNNSFATAMAPSVNAQLQTDSEKAVAEQPSAGNYSGEGYFADQFKNKKNKSLQTATGVSKTFKTASGWSDGKFYILANDIEPGTIVKLTADNGSSVYAKVLWNLGDMKDNAGINFRVSNATAAALREDAASFNLNISF